MRERVATLYDIHGNAPALRAALEEVRHAAADTVVIGGDIVSGPFPAETLALVTDLIPAPTVIRGNADREAVEWGLAEAGEPPIGEKDIEGRRTAFVASQLTRQDRLYLAQLPLTATLDIAGLGVTLFCHATPSRDDETFTERSPPKRIEAVFASVRHRTVVCGHTHMQFDLTLANGQRIVNAGSVGQPYEGRAGAYWALLSADGVELRRTDYDFSQAQELIEASAFPFADIHVSDLYVAPPTREDALAVFEP